MKVSERYIDDALFYLATIVPMVYLFGESPDLLASSAHFLSVACAGIGHSDRLNGPQTFFLVLVTTLTILVDAGICLTSARHYQDVPQAAVHLPIAMYCILTGLLRLFAVCRAARSVKEIGLAISGSIKGAHLALLLLARADDIFAELLAVTVLYSITSVVVAAAQWGVYSTRALVTCFFVDYAILTLHTRNTLAGASPQVGMLLAVAAFSVSATLLLTVVQPGDVWAKALTFTATAAFAFVAFAEWRVWAPAEGSAFVAYFGSAVVRCFIFSGDSLLTTRVAASVFAAVDVAAVAAAAFTSMRPPTESVSGAVFVACALLLLVVTLFVLFENIHKLNELWALVIREVDAAKATRTSKNEPGTEATPDNIETIEHEATMLALSSSLNVDSTYTELHRQVIQLMKASLAKKQVWNKAMFIRRVCCSLRQRAGFMETASAPKMLTDLADALEQPDTLNLFELDSGMYASDPSGDAGKCRMEDGVFKMLQYALSVHGAAETKRRFFVIAAKRTFSKSTDFERKIVAWRVAYT